MPRQLFTDLAGSNFLTIPSNLSSEEVIQLLLGLNLAEFSRIKVVFDEYNFDFITNVFQKYAQSSSLNFNISAYNSNFFRFTREQSKIWLDKNPIDGFVIVQVNKENEENVEIIKNLLVNSFAVKITKDEAGYTMIEDDPSRTQSILDKFDESFMQSGLKTYLVKSESDDIVGCYSLVKIGDEVQLSGVAGRTNLSNCFKGKKLIVLCQAMISSFLVESEFQNINYLTLSNSKKPVAEMYASLDIPKNGIRKGLLVEFGR